MTNLGKIRVGDLGKKIDILFQETTYLDVNQALDLTSTTSIVIVFIDPDGNIIGPFDMTKINSPGVDGLARYVTNSTTSLFDRPGFWHWYGIAFFTSEKSATNDAIREVLE